MHRTSAHPSADHAEAPPREDPVVVVLEVAIAVVFAGFLFLAVLWMR